ncbi:MAG: protein jag [Bdellovibrionales bacterium]
MTGLFEKLFGKKKKESDSAEGLIEGLLARIIELGHFDLSYDLETAADGTIKVNVYGADEELLTSKEGQLLDALQLYIRRALQHQCPDQNVNVNLDCSNFREQANEALVQLAEKLKGIALEKGKSVYFRALPPKDRKVIHQYLAEDNRVKSRSIGEGHFKKIKIYPVKSTGSAISDEPESPQDEVFGTR